MWAADGDLFSCWPAATSFSALNLKGAHLIGSGPPRLNFSLINSEPADLGAVIPFAEPLRLSPSASQEILLYSQALPSLLEKIIQIVFTEGQGQAWVGILGATVQTPPDQQPQHHLGTCWKCEVLFPSQTYCITTCRVGLQSVSQSFRWFWVGSQSWVQGASVHRGRGGMTASGAGAVWSQQSELTRFTSIIVEQLCEQSHCITDLP